MPKIKKQWKEIDDQYVRLLWKKNCECPESEATGDTSVSPTFFQDNGTPICGECGEDMVYVRTEILS